MEKINHCISRKCADIVLEAVDRHSEQLVWFLNHDACLTAALGTNNPAKISKQDFIGINKKWSFEKCADLFAIVLEEKAIGMIALSHQDVVSHTARIGYWLGSGYWNRGYTTKAFQLILDLAKRKNLQYVRSTVKKDDIASRKIWARYGAQSVLEEHKYSFAIELKKI